MSYTFDLQIFDDVNGRVDFEVPSYLVTGLGKLMQRVVITLLSGDSNLSRVVGGSANTGGITDDFMTKEAARVTDFIKKNTAADAPEEEKLDYVKLSGIYKQGTYTGVLLEVRNKASETEKQTLNI